jgi:hypothetical protein
MYLLYLLTLLTYFTYSFMELSPSWGAANCAATQELPSIYGTRRFNVVFTRAFHWSLSWGISIQSTPSHPIFLRSKLINYIKIISSTSEMGRWRSSWFKLWNVCRSRERRLQFLGLNCVSKRLHNAFFDPIHCTVYSTSSLTNDRTPMGAVRGEPTDDFTQRGLLSFKIRYR